MDRITQSLFDEFSCEHDLGHLAEDRRFEHFVAYVTIRRYHNEIFDTSNVVVGSGADTGIDAIAIIVNGMLITDVEEFEEHANISSSLDGQFILRRRKGLQTL